MAAAKQEAEHDGKELEVEAILDDKWIPKDGVRLYRTLWSGYRKDEVGESMSYMIGCITLSIFTTFQYTWEPFGNFQSPLGTTELFLLYERKRLGIPKSYPHANHFEESDTEYPWPRQAFNWAISQVQVCVFSESSVDSDPLFSLHNLQDKLAVIEEEIIAHTASTRYSARSVHLKSALRNIDHVNHVLEALECVHAIDDCQSCQERVIHELCGATWHFPDSPDWDCTHYPVVWDEDCFPTELDRNVKGQEAPLDQGKTDNLSEHMNMDELE